MVKYNVLEMSATQRNDEGEEMLDHNNFDALSRILQGAADSNIKKPNPPASNTSGAVNGALAMLLEPHTGI